MENDRVVLTAEQAIAMLPDGDMIHTFRNPVGGVLVGCDWDRADVIAHIGFHQTELSGEAATGMGHGIVILDLVGALFVETKQTQPQSRV